MNMISTGAFLNEMDASRKQNELVKKLVSAWEKKNSKLGRAGGVSLMALSLAACGSDDDTPFSQVDVDAAKATATTAALTDANDVVHATVDAAITSNDAAVTAAALTDANDVVHATVDAAITSNDAAVEAAVDLTTDNAAAITAAVSDATGGAYTSITTLYNDYTGLSAPAGATISVTATDEVVDGLTISSDTVSASTATYSSATVIVDSSSTDSDVFNLSITADDDIDGTVAGIETINVTANYYADVSLGMSLSGVAAGTTVTFNTVAGSIMDQADITAAKTSTLNFDTSFDDVDVTGTNNSDLTIDLARASEAAATSLVIQGATVDAVTVTSAGDLTMTGSTNDGLLTVTTQGDADITAAAATTANITTEDEAAITSMAAVTSLTLSSTGTAAAPSTIVAAGALTDVSLSGNAGANHVTVTAAGAAITSATATGDQNVELQVSGADHDTALSALTFTDSTTAGTTTVNFSATSASDLNTTAIASDVIQLSADFDTETITFGTGQTFLISASQNGAGGVTMTSALATASTNALNITIDDDSATTTTAQTIELDALAVTNTKTTTITSTLDNLLLDTSISVGAANDLVMNLAGTLTNGTGETITASSLDASGSTGAATLFLSGGVGTVSTGSGDDSLTIQGTATGGTTVNMNAGDDTLNSIDESITVDGGAGTDTVAYAATADLSGQTFALTNVEVLDIDSTVASDNTFTVDSSQVTGDSYLIKSTVGNTGTEDVFDVTVNGAVVDLSGLTVEAANIDMVVDGTAYTASSSTINIGYARC
jgi:hypothetical protein